MVRYPLCYRPCPWYAMRMRFKFWTKAPTPAPVYTCEVCKDEGVERRGCWDYCPRGHIYVGKRVGVETAPRTCPDYTHSKYLINPPE